MPRALVTGITGQDGQYLAELLRAKGYDIFGLVTGHREKKVDDLLENHPYVQPLSGDLRDMSSLISALEQSQPDEVYNLGALSFVALSFKQPELTAEVTGLGVLRMLEAIRIVGGADNNPIRFYQASSSEMFGKVRQSPQNEGTPFHPRSPYGAAKAFGHDITVNYREAYGMFACGGILFNHESPRRSPEFLPRKISKAVARISLGLQQELAVGNLDSRRDWGFAGDYVQAMWLMLQRPEPDDFVIATGETHSGREFAELAFAYVGIDDWERHVRIDPRHFRPAEVDHLVGDATKARSELGWAPTVGFEELVRMMVEADVKAEQDRL